MVRTIIAMIFVVLYCIVSIPLLGIMCIVRLFSKNAATWAMLKIVQWALGVVYKICGVSVTTIGLENVPDDEPVLFVANHQSFFDVIIASAGGIAGIVGQTNKEKANNIVPGVAIATALMPPLCTCGYAIANMNLRMLGGAAYLFLINAYFIYASACLFLSLLEIPRVRELTPAEWRRSKMKMVRNTIFVLLPCIVLAMTVGLK